MTGRPLRVGLVGARAVTVADQSGVRQCDKAWIVDYALRQHR
jgi:hypothetical protein